MDMAVSVDNDKQAEKDYHCRLRVLSRLSSVSQSWGARFGAS